jgi:hypothetical protein
MSANNGVGTVNNAMIKFTSFGRILSFNSGGKGEDLVLRAGKVGIGTITPNQKLSVEGNIKTTGKLIMASDDGKSFACGPDNSGQWKCLPYK